jgi:hypothetical protein
MRVVSWGRWRFMLYVVAHLRDGDTPAGSSHVSRYGIVAGPTDPEQHLGAAATAAAG